MFDHGNWDYDHKEFYGTTRKMKPFGSLSGANIMWANQRKQHRSPEMRKIAMRATHKATRQYLKEDLKERSEE